MATGRESQISGKLSNSFVTLSVTLLASRKGSLFSVALSAPAVMSVQEICAVPLQADSPESGANAMAAAAETVKAVFALRGEVRVPRCYY